MELYKKLKEEMQKKFIKKIIYSLGDASNENILRTANLFERFLPSDKSFQDAFYGIKKLVRKNHPSVGLIKRMIRDIDPNCKEKLVENLIIKGFMLNQKIREDVEKAGSFTPMTMLISPTMRCNLKCTGCYAANYSRENDLDIETFDQIITEGERMGTAFFVILGGEPLIVKNELFKIFKKHNNSYFQFYTNGTLFNEETIKQIRDLGNILPILSVEGYEKETDARRGKGVYKKIMNAMDLLKKYKVPFGYSIVITSKNAELISSDEFIDFMIEKGAYIGWHFLYMPLGHKPDLKLMPAPKQRKMLLDRWREIRNKKSIFVVDFWNDAPAVGGCIAGKFYVHVNSKGDVEPCIFSHFAVDNVHNKSLFQIMKSDFFRELRSKQPFNENLYMPCMWIDNPEVSREVIKKYNCYPTHPGADVIINDKKIKAGIDKYSKEVKRIYDPIWAEEKRKSECNCGVCESCRKKKR